MTEVTGKSVQEKISPKDKLDQAIASGVVTEPQNKGDPYYCNPCDKILKTKQTMKDHIDRSTHKHKLSEKSGGKSLNADQKEKNEKGPDQKPEIHHDDDETDLVKKAFQDGKLSRGSSDDSYVFYCHVCQQELKIESRLGSHLSSKKHQSKVPKKTFSERDGKAINHPVKAAKPEGKHAYNLPRNSQKISQIQHLGRNYRTGRRSDTKPETRESAKSKTNQEEEEEEEEESDTSEEESEARDEGDEDYRPDPEDLKHANDDDSSTEDEDDCGDELMRGVRGVTKSSNKCKIRDREACDKSHKRVSPVTSGDKRVYSVMSEPRGHVYVFNYQFKANREKDSNLKFREGADQDSINLRITFKRMGYEVFIFDDFNTLETLTKLDEIKTDSTLRSVDCFVMCFLSHGHSPYTFFTSDGQTLELKSIQEKFYDHNCPQLRGKPKIFFANYCRGKKIQLYETDGIVAPKDMATIHACLEGFAVLRTEEGTIFVKTLCDVLKKHARDQSLEEIVYEITCKAKKVGGSTPKLELTDFKKFFFNPK